MSETWLELLGVTARLYPEGAFLPLEARELIEEEGIDWHCSEGNDLSDENIICQETGKLNGNVILFEFNYPSSLCYSQELYSDFSFLEWEHEYLLEGTKVLEHLAVMAKALLKRQSRDYDPSHAVRFLTAWEATTTPGGYFLDGWEPPETEAVLIGWANITLEGMTIVPIEELIKEVLQ